MFIEPSLSGMRRGWIEVICGSMFSGKTEELIRRLKRVEYARLQVRIFKPRMDIRYEANQIVSHDENKILSVPLAHSREMIALADDADVIGIDEAQFFDMELPEVCEQLARKGMRVIVAGLDMDYKGLPFGPIPYLMARADYVTKLHAICVKCGSIATYSYRKSNDTDTLLLGEKDLYEPRCRNCYYEK